MTGGLPYLDEQAVFAALSPAAAVEAVASALRDGLDPADGVPRSTVPLRQGELLLMPADTATHVGVKLAAVAPDNPGRGLPRVSAVYVLFDGSTLQPRAVLDGAALTTLRTPAVSVAAVRPWLDRLAGALRLVVFGAGPQGWGHVETLAAVAELARVDVVVRQPDRVQLPGGGAAAGASLHEAGSDRVAELLRAADVVVCATTAREPLFDSALLGDRAVVLAVGSHEPDAREVDAAFLARANVVVEDVATALRECGDVVLALAANALDPDDLLPMAAVVRGLVAAAPGPVLFKGSGMSWQDLVVAEAVLAASV